MRISDQPGWLFLDLNSYFASVEQQENPALRGRPLIVVPAQSDYTCAIAASAEAKRFGIRTGTKVGEAKRLCPGLVCVSAKHGKYVDYHHRILDEVIRHVPINKIWSVDELSSRLPERLRNEEAARGVAMALKQGIARTVGECITCSVGIAPNSFLAKVATDMQKPDGLVVLRPDDMRERLFALSLRDLPGINVNMERRLAAAGIRSVAQLWHTAPKQARKIWGGVGGERFWDNLHGYEIPDQATHTGMIGHSRVLDPELRRPAEARLIARRLTVKAASRLRRQEFFATSFHLGVRTADGHKWAAENRMAAAQDNFTFLGTLDGLWADMLAGLNPVRLRKVSVVLHGLRRRGDITPDLFDLAAREQVERRLKNEKLSGLLDRINEKYGAETVRIGMTPQTQAGHVGTKIAFSRIPDRAEFHE